MNYGGFSPFVSYKHIYDTIDAIEEGRLISDEIYHDENELIYWMLQVMHRWNDVLRFELKKLSGLEIYKISITHNLKDNNFNTYLYLQGGSS